MTRLITTIARNTFVESIRQPIFFILVLAGIVAQIFNVLLSTYSLGFSDETEVSADNKILLDMSLATIMVVGLLLAAFVATAVISREIENKTVLTVVSKPISRPSFVIGKFLGVFGAILIAVSILCIHMLFAIRHEVMSTARDKVDMIVMLFGGGVGVVIPVLIAAWGNYFFGWIFSSTATFIMLPASLLGYVITLTIDKEWAFQPIGTDFKPQIVLAAICVVLSLMVLTSVAVALSTRLGQVMTIVFSAAVFLVGLLSNHLLGRHAFDNEPIATIYEVEETFPDFNISDPTAQIGVTFTGPAARNLAPGDSVYYGADPSGIALAVPEHKAFEGELTLDSDIRRPDHPSFIISEFDGTSATFLNTGGLPIARPPQPDDYVFATPTDVSWPERVAWSAIPNFQFYWLVDAVTQGHDIPLRYVGMVAGYSFIHTIGFVALGIALFQTRDVG